jgi:choice-of-anchor A domain-containing protein
MKVKLAITSVFIALLFSGACTIDASPVPLGNAAGFAALSISGDLTDTKGVVTGPLGVAAPGSTFSANPIIPNSVYVRTDTTVSPAGQPVNRGPFVDSYLAQAIVDAQNASSEALALGQPGSSSTVINLGDISTNQSLTQATQGKYVYNIGTWTGNLTLTVSAPAGSTVIINVTGTLSGNAMINIVNAAGSGLTTSDILLNIPGSTGQAANTVTVGSNGVFGILLAPVATVSIPKQTVSGQVISEAILLSTGTIISSGLPPINIVPEPISFSVVALGTALLLGHRLLRRPKPPG